MGHALGEPNVAGLHEEVHIGPAGCAPLLGAGEVPRDLDERSRLDHNRLHRHSKTHDCEPAALPLHRHQDLVAAVELDVQYELTVGIRLDPLIGVHRPAIIGAPERRDLGPRHGLPFLIHNPSLDLQLNRPRARRERDQHDNGRNHGPAHDPPLGVVARSLLRHPSDSEG